MKTKTIVTITIVLFLASMGSVVPAKASSSWYDLSWIRRKTITIDNTLNPNVLVDYQVKIDVDYDSDMNNDFSDLRFTDSDAVTPIPYWIENYTDSVSAVVWVKVPSIQASSTTIIYVYYGNPVATSESDIKETFVLGDDFNDNSLDTNLWETGYGTYSGSLPGGYVSETNQEIYIRTELTPGQWWVQSRYLVSKQNFNLTEGIAVDYKMKAIHSADCRDQKLWLLPQYGTTLGDLGHYSNYITQGYRVWGVENFSLTKVISGTGAIIYNELWAFNEEYIPYSLTFTSSIITAMANGTEKYSGVNDLAFSTGYIYAAAEGRGYEGPPYLSEAYFDDVRVRKYTLPEPTITIGPEEHIVEPLDINMDVGSLYFKGETAEFYVQTVFKGTAVDVTSISAMLYKPDGTTEILMVQRIATGLYKTTYTIGKKQVMKGTYALVVEANQTISTVDAIGTSVKTFLVKDPYQILEKEVKTASLAGAMIVIVALAILWRRKVQQREK